MSEINPRTKYQEVMVQASLPLAERPAIVPGRKGKYVAPRRYHLKDEKIQKVAALQAEKGRFVAPFRRGGAYWGVVEALAILGVNQRHLFKDVMSQMKTIMGDDSTKDKKTGKTAWDRFTARSPKNPTNARDVIGKILQNIEVLQRLGGNHPYGLKLSQLGAAINVYKKGDTGEDGMFIELRIGGSVTPVNERRSQRKGKTEVTTVKTEESVVEIVTGVTSPEGADSVD